MAGARFVPQGGARVVRQARPDASRPAPTRGGAREQAIELKERAFELYRATGQFGAASASAQWMAFMHVTYAGNLSAGLGWKERAETVLESVEESAAHGWLEILRAPFADVPEWKRKPTYRDERSERGLVALATDGDP